MKPTLDNRFFAAGVNYRTAPVQVRERMAVAHPDRMEVSRLLKLKAGLGEVVVLWTCNRVEIYGVVNRGVDPDVKAMFACLTREMPGLAEHVYCHRGLQALRHLFRVAGGLDSMVLGETQITGQVRDAYEEARKQGLTGKVLNSVFQKALQNAKAIRTNTSIGRGARSVGGVAVAHARDVLGLRKLKEHRVLMIGAGEMAVCCLRHLQKKGRSSVTVANRSPERAEALAREFKGTAIPLSEMYEAMISADVVISSTGSSGILIHQPDLLPVMEARNGRPLVLIDIAVPRDIDPTVSQVEGVHLCDIDALEKTVDRTLQRWDRDLERCSAIIEAGVEELVKDFEARAGYAQRHGNKAVQAVAV
jgi:glutamyl-tRNA reductase